MFGSSKQRMSVLLAASALLLNGSQAQATMLVGGVEESSFFKGSPVSSFAARPQTKPKAKPIAHYKDIRPAVKLSAQVPGLGKVKALHQTNTVVPNASPTLAQIAKPLTTPSTVQGVWLCTTQVVESSAPTVQPGTVVECQIRFQALDANRVVAQWAQQGWAPSAAAVGQCGGGMLRIVHESANQGSSAAHSDDYVQVVNPNIMRSVSVVNQFENGAYAGSYKTQSILKRI